MAFWKGPGHFGNISKQRDYGYVGNILKQIHFGKISKYLNWDTICKCCCYLIIWKFVMLSIIGNICQSDLIDNNMLDCFWLVTKLVESLDEYLLDWLQKTLIYCQKTLIYCQKTLIYCQNILINCQKFPTMLITSIKNALDSTLSWGLLVERKFISTNKLV